MAIALLKAFASDCWPALVIILGMAVVGALQLDSEDAFLAGGFTVMGCWFVDRGRR